MQFLHFATLQDLFSPFVFSFCFAMPTKAPANSLMPPRMVTWFPSLFTNIEKGQWVVFLKKGFYGARFSGLVSKVEKGKVMKIKTEL